MPAPVPVPLITAVAPRWEAELAGALARSRIVHVARRCADVAELLGVAAAGIGRVAVVSSDLRQLDRGAVDTLTTHGLVVLGVHPPDDAAAERTLRRWGLAVVLPADAAAADLDAALQELLDGGAPTQAEHQEAGSPPTSADSRSGGAGQAATIHGQQGQQGQHGQHRQQGQHSQRSSQGHQGHRATTQRRTPAGRIGDEHLEHPGSATDQEVAGHAGTDGDPLARGQDELSGQDAPVSAAGAPDEPEEGQEGEIVVVWGPHGSPGRTTVAVNLAAELADSLHEVVLVDADTYGASIGQHLAILDEVPGVAAAARLADQGSLDPSTLADLAPEARPGLRVLTGLPRADRWPELREPALADVLQCCRELARWTVVDVSANLEQDEELSFDTLAPRRNGAALTALEAADQVVVVGAGDPVGLQRLVRGLDLLSERSSVPRTVVITRVRSGAVGRDPGRRIREALERFAGVRKVELVPEDQEGLDASLLHGQALAEARPRSPARLALVALADVLAGRPPASHTRGAQGRTFPRFRRATS